MKTIAVLSNEIPDAWFAGQEIHLIRDAECAQRVPVPLRAGMCGYLALLPSLLAEVDGLVLTTCCDQMRRAAEWLNDEARVFLFNMPSTLHQERLLSAEKMRLARWVKQLPLRGSRREKVKGSRDVARTQGAQDERPIATGDALSVGVLGGHFCGDEQQVRRFFAVRGLRVALWGCEGGEPVASVFQRPNDAFYDAVKATLAARHMDGLIVVRTTWCDVWRLACVRLREVLPVPVLEWVLDGHGHGQPFPDGASVTRLDAFCELLQMRKGAR